MKPFTRLQREEIEHKIDVRQESIEDDMDSASGIELEEGALDNLRAKIRSGIMDFTEGERQWIVSELENAEDIGWSNMRSEGPEKVNGYIGSMRNAINKISGDAS